MAILSLQNRVQIQVLAQEGKSDVQIAQQLRLNKHTVRKWRRRGQGQVDPPGAGLIGRPCQGALSTYPSRFAQMLRNWRTAHPGWGPKTLYAELLRHPAFQGERLPSKATLFRWLHQEQFARAYQKHVALPAKCVSPAAACHEEWEMDARGHEKIPKVGVVSLINVNDVFSKVKIMSYPCWLGQTRLTHSPKKEDYQVVLRLAFTQWGLPDRLAVDHGSSFYDNRSKSPYPTPLHFWLIALGVDLTFGRPGQPRDQAMTERSHQIWDQQVLEGQSFATPYCLFQALNQRRTFLNNCLPCASLGEVAPLVAHPEALQPRRVYRPEWEAELLDLERIYAYLSQGRWFRKGSGAFTISLGQEIYYLGKACEGKEVQITFDPKSHELIFQTPDWENRQAIQGVSIQSLMGEMGPLAHLQDFQLALPLTWNDWSLTLICKL